MLWIKRNLFFVISVAVGLALTGYCSYLLYSSLAANAGVSEETQSTLSNLEAMQQKSPYPSNQNITAAREDQQRVRNFLIDFRKRFAALPTPPAEDEMGFKTYLEESLVRFRAGATNAEVQVPPDYAYSFSGLIGKLTYPSGSIAPWMQQLEEIAAILNILYGAKINSLEGLQRAPVSVDDSGGTDLLGNTAVTNQWGVVSPYKFTFRGFSTEIAAVLEGFARSSNCFIIQAISVTPDKTVQQQMETQEYLKPQQPVMVYVPEAQPNPGMGYRGGRERGERGMPPPRQAPRYVPTYVTPAAGAGSSAGSLFTVLSESPLTVTIWLDVVKLKATEH